MHERETKKCSNIFTIKTDGGWKKNKKNTKNKYGENTAQKICKFVRDFFFHSLHRHIQCHQRSTKSITYIWQQIKLDVCAYMLTQPPAITTPFIWWNIATFCWSICWQVEFALEWKRQRNFKLRGLYPKFHAFIELNTLNQKEKFIFFQVNWYKCTHKKWFCKKKNWNIPKPVGRNNTNEP